MPAPLATTKGTPATRIKRVSWKHDDMIDVILQRSGSLEKFTQGDLAKEFGVTEAWMSCIINSDSFQARLAERKAEIVDPLIRGDMEEAIKGLVTRSVGILRERLEKKPTFENALEVFKAAGRNLGLGQKANVQVNVNGANSLISILSGIPAQQENVVEGEVIGGASAAE